MIIKLHTLNTNKKLTDWQRLEKKCHANLYSTLASLLSYITLLTTKLVVFLYSIANIIPVWFNLYTIINDHGITYDQHLGLICYKLSEAIFSLSARRLQTSNWRMLSIKCSGVFEKAVANWRSRLGDAKLAERWYDAVSHEIC